VKQAHHAVIALLGVEIIFGRHKQLCNLQTQTFAFGGCRASWLVLMRTTSGLRYAMMTGKRSGSVSPRSASGLLH